MVKTKVIALAAVRRVAVPRGDSILVTVGVNPF
eukprot:SAG11_NODE_31476_length_291_cov_1.229167_1_plen_32_part_10